MELRYPLIVILLVIALICYIFLGKKRKVKFTKGSKIANTNYIKNTILLFKF